MNPTEKQLGNLYEDIFSDFMNDKVNYIMPEPLGAKGLNFQKNDTKWSDAQDRNTVPDFTARSIYSKSFLGLRYSAPKIVENGSAFEVKQSNGGIYLSSNNYQIKGHIDNMAARFSKLMANGFNEATFTLVTTADIRWSPSMSKYASSKGIQYFHVTGQYKIVNGRWKFKFVSVLGRIWQLIE